MIRYGFNYPEGNTHVKESGLRHIAVNSFAHCEEVVVF